MTLFSTLNQYGVFSMNLLLGFCFGGFLHFTLFLVSKIKNNKGLCGMVEIVLYFIFGIANVLLMTQKEYVDFGLYIPLSALLGVFMYNFGIKKMIITKH